MLSVKDSTGKRYYHTDHIGSIRKITDERGKVKTVYRYYAFGKKRFSKGEKKRHSFTGREDEEEFGLMYYRARYYDPSIGRFISPDPFTRGPDDPRISYRNNWYAKVHGEATLYAEWLNPHNFNRYLYCNNNLVRYVDPLGLDVTKIDLIGIRTSLVIGGLFKISFVKDDCGNYGFSFKFGIGIGVETGTNFPEKTVYKAIENSMKVKSKIPSIDKNKKTIYDLEGIKTEAFSHVILGVKSDIDKGTYEKDIDLSVGGGVYKTLTVVVNFGKAKIPHPKVNPKLRPIKRKKKKVDKND